MTAPDPARLHQSIRQLEGDGGRVDVEQLERLLAAATPGPWDADICEGELTVSAGSAKTTWTEHDGVTLGDPPSGYLTTDRIYEHDLDDWDGRQTQDDKQREADADLIVALRNAAPALLDLIRRQDAALTAKQAVIDAVTELTEQSDDGTEYEHNSGCCGEAECPACWVTDIRRALASPDTTQEA